MSIKKEIQASDLPIEIQKIIRLLMDDGSGGGLKLCL
jgi:hypothetical protein